MGILCRIYRCRLITLRTLAYSNIEVASANEAERLKLLEEKLLKEGDITESDQPPLPAPLEPPAFSWFSTWNDYKSLDPRPVIYQPAFAKGQLEKAKKTYGFGPLVNSNKTLQNLVELGVDLSKLSGRQNAANLVLNLEWEKDVVPVLCFLAENGMPLTELGEYLTRNPWIFQQDLEDLRIRINYLMSKNFSKASITRIVSKARYWLNLDVKTVDKRLGWFQREFALMGDEVRFVVTKAPNLVSFGIGHVQLLRFSFHEEMGFSVDEMKTLLLKDPRIWMTKRETLRRSFDYVQFQMGFSHRRIVEDPAVLRFPLWHIENRHLFLQSLGKDQYDPQTPNYVSLTTLVHGTDSEFCQSVAKCPVSLFNKFLKKQ